jgi:hypothetical protein
MHVPFFSRSKEQLLIWWPTLPADGIVVDWEKSIVNVADQGKPLLALLLEMHIPCYGLRQEFFKLGAGYLDHPKLAGQVTCLLRINQ